MDDAIDLDSKKRLETFLDGWIKKFVNEELRDLVNLKNKETKNSKVRALCFQLFENNGVLKREKLNKFIKDLLPEDKTQLRKLGIKIGRYHIYLHKMLKPSAVGLRTKLWENFYGIAEHIKPPQSGLNFIVNNDKNISNFFLICGFENFGSFGITRLFL